MGKARSEPRITRSQAVIPLGGTELSCRLSVPDAPYGIVLFAGSHREHADDQEHRFVELLGGLGVATVDVGVIPFAGVPTPSAISAREHYNLHRDVQRLLAATDWIATSDLSALPLGYVGAGVAAVAALHATAARPADVRAIVMVDPSLDGVARDLVSLVQAPTLCISSRPDCLRPSMIDSLHCEFEHRFVQGPSPLAEGGALAETCALADSWLRAHLKASKSDTRRAPVVERRAH
jgi:hypothetical protein